MFDVKQSSSYSSSYSRLVYLGTKFQAFSIESVDKSLHCSLLHFETIVYDGIYQIIKIDY